MNVGQNKRLEQLDLLIMKEASLMFEKLLQNLLVQTFQEYKNRACEFVLKRTKEK